MEAGDVEAVARLHAESWIATYRGTLSDAYLDGPVYQDRLAVWRARWAAPHPALALVATAEASTLGFLFALAGHDPRYGTLVDSLHVAPDARARGIGSSLLLALCQASQARGNDAGVHLWVHENNQQARDYYRRLGAAALRRERHEAPGGGAVTEILYVWEATADLERALKRKTAGRWG